MNRYQIQQGIKKLAEHEIDPETIHLWPGVKQSLAANMPQLFAQGETKMNRSIKSRHRLAWASIFCITILLMGLFLLATPSGKVLAQEMLNFFKRAENNEQAVAPLEYGVEMQQPQELSAPAVQAAEEGCGSMYLPRCSMAEIQPEVPFTVLSLTDLPDGMQFSGAASIPDGAVQRYSGEKGELLLIEQAVQERGFSTWMVGKDAVVESLVIGQSHAEYVQGAWSGLGLESDDMVAWESDMPTRTLRWQAGGIDFALVHFPAKGVYGPSGYDIDQLKSIAEGLQAGMDAASIEPENALNLAEAEISAGFGFKSSGWIPAGLALYQTTYDSQHNSICQYYYGSMSGSSTPALVIVQSTWALPSVEEIQTKAYYGDTQVEIATSQETLPISGANGDQGTFIETGLQIDSLCGGKPASANRVLMWQQNDRTYAVFTALDGLRGGAFVTKLEMQHLAESLTGAAAGVEMSDLDPERLSSLQDAETMAGYDIQQPFKMLTNVHFDHITVGAFMGYPSRVITQYLGQVGGPGGSERVVIYQTPNSQQTLDDLRQAGGYTDATVKGNPAIYQAQCYDDPAAGLYCSQMVSWFVGAVQYDMEAYFPALIPKETFLEIAESMQ